MPTSRRVVALTFDAGGDDSGVASILATLSAQHVPASFFMTGAWVERYPAQARRLAAAGRVANHTVNHPHLTQETNTEIRSEIDGDEAIIKRVCGVNPEPWFRFPYGDRDSRTISVVNAAGYVPIRWTVDTLGWEGTSEGITAQTVLDRVKAAARPGEIVLMHVGANPKDHSTLDADALPKVISALRSAGYSFVTLDALLSMG